MPGVSGSYSSGGSRLWPIVAFLLGMALIAMLVALAFAMGMLRLPEGGFAGGASPRPTTVAASAPTTQSLQPTATTGPTAPPAATPAPSTAAAPTPGGIHVVQSGETLFSIGILYGIPWQLIAEANGIEDENYIELGQQLVIPVPAPPSAGATTHIIQPGESIYSIAEIYGITPTELADANDIEDWDLIQAGDVLVIPGAGAAPTATP
jgi:LysM repeat protein